MVLLPLELKKINHVSEEINLEESSKVIIQKFIDGIEISLDGYVSRNFANKFFSPRIRIETQGGEVVNTKIIQDKEVTDLAEHVSNTLQLTGPFNIQFIREFATNKLFLMEVNSRFGGGVIASIKSGFDFPKVMLSELLDLQTPIIKAVKQLQMVRYYKEAFYEINN